MSALSFLAALALGAPPRAGFAETARAVGEENARWWDAGIALRLRETLRYNLDLDHGLSPSGEPLFATPDGDPSAQLMHGADLRLRVDLGARTPTGGVGVFVQLDALDNLRLGSTPEGIPSATTSQRPPESAMLLRRAYGVALTPFGFLAAGRMGSHWGLGLLTHGGDCADCDSGDAADRVAFMTSLANHLWAVSYDFSATGPGQRAASGAVVDVDPTDDVHTVTFAVMSAYSDLSRERRRRAERVSVEYGAYVSHRWQDNDAPASYLPIAAPEPLSATQVMHRGFRATAVDGWFRLTAPWGRVELEAALLLGHIEQASLIPGVLLHEAVESLQWGAALETDFGVDTFPLRGGVDFGVASGDPAPGFGVNVQATDAPPKPGDLEGPQAIAGRDNRVDNFRFHRDYRIDRILFRELIGTVTDAFYIRPHLDWTVATVGPGTLSFSLFGVFSLAMEERSTPGGTQPLGVELDPSLSYVTRDGFTFAVDYAALFPLSGLDNGTLGLASSVAQLTRFRVSYAF